MFGKLKNYAIKKLLETQLKSVPEEQRALIMALVEKNPKLFETIAKELQAEMKSNGNNQMKAAMKILPKYQQEILAVMSPEMKAKMMGMAQGIQGKFNPNGTIRK
jgi:phenylalanyl-tRNA synthetase alpha subunit